MQNELALAATKYGWQCSNCYQLFDFLWRPISPEKAYKPPIPCNWMADKPPFHFCPMCGVKFGEENADGAETCSN